MIASSVMASSPLRADDKALKLMDPLPLKTALDYAKEHPRLKLTSEQNQHYTHQHPLYLNCHQLAYNNLDSADRQRFSSLYPLVSMEQLQQLYILQSYLDVDLSDLAFMADNESMSIAYIRYDRAKTRMELKQYSEVLVAEKESQYFEQLQRYQASGFAQRLSRSVLAQEMGHLGKLPNNIIAMPAWHIPDELPELSAVLEAIKKNNSWLSRYKDDLKTAEKSLIDIQLQQLSIELLSQLEALKSANKRFEKAANFQDLNLEQSRTLYEQEVKADLGDAMAQQTRSQFQQQQISYCLNITWAQLNILQGNALLEPPPKTIQATSEAGQ